MSKGLAKNNSISQSSATTFKFVDGANGDYDVVPNLFRPDGECQLINSSIFGEKI